MTGRCLGCDCRYQVAEAEDLFALYAPGSAAYQSFCSPGCRAAYERKRQPIKPAKPVPKTGRAVSKVVTRGDLMVARCYWCDRQLYGPTRTQDHVLPKCLMLAGRRPGNNLVPACRPCNGERGQAYAVLLDAAGEARDFPRLRRLANSWARKGLLALPEKWRDLEYDKLGFCYIERLDWLPLLAVAACVTPEPYDHPLVPLPELMKGLTR